VCIYTFITLVSGFVYFGRAGSLGVSLAGRVIFSFCVGLRCVECRAGTIYLSASLGWVAGLYRFFLLGSVVVGTVRLKWWGGWSDFLGRLQFAVCSLGRRLSVVGLPFPYNNFFSLILVLFVGLVFYKLLILF
jgi:hypothetical protein